MPLPDELAPLSPSLDGNQTTPKAGNSFSRVTGTVSGSTGFGGYLHGMGSEAPGWGIRLDSPEFPPEPTDADMTAEPLRLGIADIPERTDFENIGDDMYGLYDRAPAAIKRIFKHSPEGLQDYYRAASPERREDLRRLIIGRMEETRKLALTMPGQDITEGILAAKTGMTAGMIRHYQEHEPEYLKAQLANSEILEHSGMGGYVTEAMQDPKSAEELRYDAVLIAQIESDYLGMYEPSSLVRWASELKTGVGQVGVFATEMVAGTARKIVDFADWVNDDGDVDLSLGLGVALWHKNPRRRWGDSIIEPMRSFWPEAVKDVKARWLAPPIDTGNPITDWLRTAIGRGIPFMAASIALAKLMTPVLATGASASALAQAGGIGAKRAAAIIAYGMGEEAYSAVRDAGGSPLAAWGASAGAFTCSFLANVFQLDRWTRNLAGRSPWRVFSINTGVEIAEEMGSEFSESLGQGLAIATANLASAPGYTRERWWKDVTESFREARDEGAAAAVLAACTRILGLPKALRSQAYATLSHRKFLAITDTIGKTELFKKKQDLLLSKTLNQTARHHGGSGVMFASIADLEQGGLTRKQLLDGLGIGEAEYAYARDSNVDLTIPFGNAAVFARRQAEAGNTHFLNVIRAEPDILTGKEIYAQEREMSVILEQAEANFKALADRNEATAPLRIRIFRAGLRAANLDVNQADAAAAMFWARAQRAAELWGETPEQWLERRDVQMEMRTAIKNSGEFARYEKLLTESRVRNDIASGRAVDVFEASETLYGSPPGSDAAAPADPVPQSGIAEALDPALTSDDSRAWGDAVAKTIADELGVPDTEREAIAKEARNILNAGREMPEAKILAEQIGIDPAADAGSADSGRKPFDPEQSPISELYQDEIHADPLNNGEAALRRDSDAWRKIVDDFIAGNLPARQPVTMLRQTPLVLQMLGAKNLPVTTSYGILKKIMVDKHKLPPETVKQIPAALADPVMVFRSATQGGDLVVMLDIKDQNGSTIIVPIGLEQKGPLGYTVNFVFSVYGKMHERANRPNNQWFAEQVSQGKLLYRNMKKSRDWARTARLQLPGVGASNRGTSIVRTETDLVKLREKNPTLYQSHGERKSPRGEITLPQYHGAPAVIRLFEKADISTIIHELNHLFIFDLQQMVAAGRGGEMARSHLAALTQFAGGKLDRAGYEKIARAWERYAMDGKAPSPELYDAFDVFRTYIARIYQNAVQGLDIEPSPEVRAVFDRFLATDQQIAAARELAQQSGHWEDFALENGPGRQRIKDGRARVDAARRRKQDAHSGGRAWRDMPEIATLREKMGKATSSIPIYNAIDTIRRGGGMNRAAVETLTSKATADAIAARHGEKIFGGSADMDAVAERTGYQNAKAMLAEIAETITAQEYVDGQIAEELRRREPESTQEDGGTELFEEDGIDVEEESLVEQIEESIEANGGGARALREWRLKHKAMKAAAARLVGAMEMRDAVDLRRFNKAKRDAGRKALAAARKGDATKVTEHLNLELMHHITVRECMRARDLENKVKKEYGTKRLIATIEGGEHQARVENAYAEAIKAVATFMGFTDSRKLRPQVDGETIPFPTYEPGTNVAAFVPDIAGSVDPWLFNKVLPAEFQNWKDFTYDQIKEADRVLTVLIRQGRGELHALRDLETGNLEELARKSIAPMERRTSRPGLDNDERTWLGKVLNKANRYLTSLACPEYWFMMMDGNPTIQGKESGINQKLFWKMRDCQLAKDQLYKGMLERMTPHFAVIEQAKAELEKRFGGRFFHVAGLRLPEILKKGRNISTWDANLLVAAALQMGNDASLYRLTGIRKDGEAVYDENCYNFTIQELRTLAGLFSADQWKAIQGIWDGIDSLYPQLDAVTFRITNRHVVKEKALPLTVNTSDGKTLALKGGYFPLINDPLLSARGADLKGRTNIEDAIYAGMMDNIHQSTKPAAGMTKERLRDEEGNPVVRLPQILDTRLIVKHLEATIHYITHAEAVLEMDRLTRHRPDTETGTPGWRDEYIDKFGHERYRAIRNWVQDLARPNRMNNEPGQQILEYLRALATINALGLRPVTAAKQQLGLFQAAAFMTDASRTRTSGWKYLKKGLRELGWGGLIGKKTDKMHWVDSLSPYMAARSGSHNREINAVISRISPMNQHIRIPLTNLKIDKVKLHDGMFAMINASDQIGAYATWIGAYEQAMAGEANFDIMGMADAKRHENAVRYADAAAATQASSFQADLTAVQRSEGIMRFVSMFMSGNIRQGSRLMQYVDAYRLGDKTGGDIAWLAFREFVAPAMAWALMAAIIKTALGDDDDDLLSEAAWEVAETAIAPFPIFREAPSIIRYGSEGNVPALSAPAKSIGRGFRGLKRAVDGRYLDAATDAGDAAGFWLGVPFMNVIRQGKPAGRALGLLPEKKK